MSDNAYAIFRHYSDDERRSLRTTGIGIQSQNKFFGWSESKHTVRLFRMQRDPKKYIVKVIDRADIRELGGRRTIEDLQLELITLRSNRLCRDIPFMTTAEERNGFEIKIRQLFVNACSIDVSIGVNDNDCDVPSMIRGIANLRPAYAQALEVIGYQNSELNAMFDSVDDDDPPWDEYDYKKVGYGCTIGKVIIYSLESVVKVLLNEM